MPTRYSRDSEAVTCQWKLTYQDEVSL